MIRFLALLLLVLTPSALANEPIARLIGVDDPQLSNEILTILGESAAPTSDPVSMRRDLRTAQDRALRFLRSEGYYAAQVRASLPEGERPLLEITTGPKFHVQSVSVDADTQAANDAASGAISLPAGTPLDARRVLDAEIRGLAALTSRGWPLARAEERDVLIDHALQSGTITFHYTPGPFLSLGQIDLETEDWDRDFIERLSPSRVGSPVNLNEIRDYEARLETLASVRNATLTLVQSSSSPEQGNIHVELDPAPRHAIEAELGLSTSEGAGIELAWSRRNLMGSDETLTLRAELASLVQSLEARLVLPHWRMFDQNLILGSGIRTEDTDAYRQNEISVQAEIERPFNEDLNLRLGVLGDVSRLTDAEGERDISTLRLTSALAFDQRDDPLDSRSGVQAAILFNPGVSFGDTSATYVQAEARASTYYPLNNNFTAAARIRFGSILGASADDLPADIRFYAGGGGSARGFDYQSLTPIGTDGAPAGGLSVTEFNAEIRWRGPGRWGAVAFLDSAFAGDNTLTDFEDLRTGIGLGLRYYLDFAPVRLDLATPINRRPGEDPVHLYISIGQAF